MNGAARVSDLAYAYSDGMNLTDVAGNVSAAGDGDAGLEIARLLLKHSNTKAQAWPAADNRLSPRSLMLRGPVEAAKHTRTGIDGSAGRQGE